MGGVPRLSRLPPELRNEIWRMLLEPRNVEVRWSPRDAPISPFYTAFVADAPILLYINHESRAYAIKRGYVRVYRHPFWATWCQYTWVNFDIDNLWVHQAAIPLIAYDVRHELIRHLTVKCTDVSAFYGDDEEADDEGHGKHLILFPRLKTVTVLVLGLDVNDEDEVELAYDAFYLMMMSLYWTCRPAHFDIRVCNPRLLAPQELRRDNFGQVRFTFLAPTEGTDLQEASARAAAVLGPISLALDKRPKEGGHWIHGGCRCEKSEDIDIDMTDHWPHFRLTPHWDSDEQKLLNKDSLWFKLE